jgi:hypothetical protein
LKAARAAEALAVGAVTSNRNRGEVAEGVIPVDIPDFQEGPIIALRQDLARRILAAKSSAPAGRPRPFRNGPALGLSFVQDGQPPGRKARAHRHVRKQRDRVLDAVAVGG